MAGVSEWGEYERRCSRTQHGLPVLLPALLVPQLSARTVPTTFALPLRGSAVLRGSESHTRIWWIGLVVKCCIVTCMHAPNTMSLSTLNCSRPAASSCSESDAALSSLGNREYTCLSNLYSKFSKVHVSAKHVGCSGGHAPPRKSLLPF